jgi:hypothetical protein
MDEFNRGVFRRRGFPDHAFIKPFKVFLRRKVGSFPAGIAMNQCVDESTVPHGKIVKDKFELLISG